MASTVTSEVLAARVAKAFQTADGSSGRATLLLESELELTITRVGRSDQKMVLPKRLEVHFPHNQNAKHGQGDKVTIKDRSERHFTITANDGTVLAVTNVNNGVMSVATIRTGTPQVRRSKPQITLSNLAVANG